MSHSSNIAVLIPAAGASQRMGTAKQLLKWGDSTLIGHTIETARYLNCHKIFVVLGANLKKIEKTIESFPVEILHNEKWRLGLGKSIAFGIEHIRDLHVGVDGVLIMLADQPLIDVNYLGTIIENFRPGEGQIVATEYDDLSLGIPILFDRIYFKDLIKLNGDKGAKAIIKNYSEMVTTLNGKGKTADIDTEEDYWVLYDANHQ